VTATLELFVAEGEDEDRKDPKNNFNKQHRVNSITGVERQMRSR
jgi:hypothetical protein